MRKTINGLVYDTHTGIIVALTTSEKRDPLRYWEATMYKTPMSGKYFLAGSGGAMSIFGKYKDHVLTYGEKILPLTDKCAMAWVRDCTK